MANFGENGKFGKNITWTVWTKFKWDDKRATLTITDLSKSANFCQKWWIWLIKKTVLKIRLNKRGYRNASNSCSHGCIRSNQQNNVLGCFLQWPVYSHPLRSKEKLDEGKDQFFSIISGYVSRELKHNLYIVFSSFLFLLMGMCSWMRSHFHV